MTLTLILPCNSFGDYRLNRNAVMLEMPVLGAEGTRPDEQSHHVFGKVDRSASPPFLLDFHCQHLHVSPS